MESGRIGRLSEPGGIRGQGGQSIIPYFFQGRSPIAIPYISAGATYRPSSLSSSFGSVIPLGTTRQNRHGLLAIIAFYFGQGAAK